MKRLALAVVSAALLAAAPAPQAHAVNSRHLCIKKSRANIVLSGHNGRRHRANPVMQASCKAKGSRVRAPG